ncbi:MAG: hypothetical protein ACFFAU_13575 [Candidatus Hodarchaeota archaeon]
MKATLDEYIDIARQAKNTHKHLIRLIALTNGKIPQEIVQPLFKMQDYYFLFKDKAEERMLRDCPEVINLHTQDYPDYTHIFYGGFKDIELDKKIINDNTTTKEKSQK